MPKPSREREELSALRARLDRLSRSLDDALNRIDRLEARNVSPASPEGRPSPTTSPPPAPVISDKPTPEVVAEIVDKPGGRPPILPKPAASPAGSPLKSEPVVATKPSTTREHVGWEALVGGKGLTWAGAVVLIIALGLTVHWAATTFQTPPQLQVAGLHLLGAALLAAGHIIHVRKLPILAQGLAGLGIFALYATGFATYRIYEFGNAYTALAEGAVITIVAIAVALRSRSAAVILLGALGGYLTPVLTSTGSGNYVALFSYLAFLNVALVACAVWRGWRFLKPMALAATAVMSAAWMVGDSFDWAVDRWGTQWFLVVHAIIFLAGTTIPPWAWRQRSTASESLTTSAGSLGFMSATWAIFHDSADQQLALVSWGLAALHLGLFAVTYSRIGNVDRLPRVQLALAAVFVTLAAPLQIDDARYLGITWCVQGLVFTGVGVFFRDRQMQVMSLVVFALALVRIFGWDYFDPSGLIAGTSIDLRFALITTAGLLIAAAGALYWLIPLGRSTSPQPTGLGRTAGGGLMAIGNFVVLLAMTCQWDGRIVLLLWTINAAAIWIVGFGSRMPALRWYALYVAVCMAGGRVLRDLVALDIGDAAPMVNARFGTLAVLAAVYAIAGWTYRRRLSAQAAEAGASRKALPLLEDERLVDPLLAVLTNVVLLVAVSLEIGHWYDVRPPDAFGTFAAADMAQMATYSVVWAVYAAVLVAVGFALRYPLLRYLGLAGLVFVLGKVFLVDLSDLEFLPRVLAFAVLGAMLLGVSYLYQRYTARLRNA